jgi:signal transduction histidine kinase
LFAGQVFGRRAGAFALSLGVLLIAGAAAIDLTGAFPYMHAPGGPGADASTWSYKLGMFGLVGAGIHVMQARISDALRTTITHMRQRGSALRALNEALEASHDELQDSRDRVRKASDAKDRLVANLSHELRTPLSAIVGFSDLLREAPNEGTRQTHIQSLRAAAVHLEQTVDRLLSVANPRHVTDAEELVETDSRELLEDVASAVRTKLKERGIQFQLRVGAEVPETMLTEPDKLSAALEQIVDNAERYTDSGCVSVTASANDAQRALVVEVKDTGMGIPEGELERLWEPFEQLTIGSEGRGGSGLGLSIARSRIAELGGDIELDSAVGAGTSVRVSIPYESTANENDATGEPIAVHQTGSFPTAISSRVLPGTLRQRLGIAAENGDFFLLCDLLEEVRSESEEAATYAKKFVDAYDYIALEKWLASGKSAGSGTHPV